MYVHIADRVGTSDIKIKTIVGGGNGQFFEKEKDRAKDVASQYVQSFESRSRLASWSFFDDAFHILHVARKDEIVTES